MIRIAYMLTSTILLLLAATSCNQKELDTLATGLSYYCEIKVTYDHRWEIPTADGPDWERLWDDGEYLMTYESLKPVDPAGLRALVYHPDGRYDIFNLPAGGGVVDLRQGTHSLLLYNNDTEYIIFNDMGNSAAAIATTRSKSRAGYVGSPFVGNSVNENTITPPDMLYARNGGEITTAAAGDTLRLEYELRPLVFKYLLRYHFTAGLQHVTMARGSLAGMATGVYLVDGHTTPDAGTLLFDIDPSQSLVYFDSVTGEGMIYTVVTTFGLPDFPNSYYGRTSTTSTQGLSLEVLLKNGATKVFDFNVTDQVALQPQGGVIDVYGLTISDDDASGSTGSFGVDIKGWGDDIYVPFM